MEDLKWLKFLDCIAMEKQLTSTQKTTLKAKFPKFDGMANSKDLIKEFGLANENGLKKRRGVLYSKFSFLKEVEEKAIALQEYLQQESLKHCEKEQDSLVENLPPVIAEPIQRTTPKPHIDWIDRSRQLLQAQKHLTTNRLLNKSNRNLDDIHVPLGLIERKERPKMKEVEDSAQGSQLYHPVEYIDTKRFEHDAFLADVVGKPAGGKHIAIIGEPGAGKTTILTKIGAWLIQQAEQPPAQLVVAWISLADIGDNSLEKYLKKKWLKKVCEDNLKAAWEDWKGLRQQGQVWLLLDGLDEMSGDALAAIHRDLGDAWAQNLRVVMTCRINQWETAAGGNILTNSFDVYRTLDYSYQTSQGDDQVKEFISKWFADNQKVATQICTELDAPGKERIKDLVKNPLRLTLLCASWEKDNQALPETQAGLYEKFVDYLYDWKAVEFFKEVELREELDLALGKLAKEGLNRQPMNDGAVRRFRFTTSEIRRLWGKQSKELLAAAKNLGWLNVVEKDTLTSCTNT
jgi:predicted NACHT family NTPase